MRLRRNVFYNAGNRIMLTVINKKAPACCLRGIEIFPGYSFRDHHTVGFPQGSLRVAIEHGQGKYIEQRRIGINYMFFLNIFIAFFL